MLTREKGMVSVYSKGLLLYLVNGVRKIVLISCLFSLRFSFITFIFSFVLRWKIFQAQFSFWKLLYFYFLFLYFSFFYLFLLWKFVFLIFLIHFLRLLFSLSLLLFLFFLQQTHVPNRSVKTFPFPFFSSYSNFTFYFIHWIFIAFYRVYSLHKFLTILRFDLKRLLLFHAITQSNNFLGVIILLCISSFS